MRWRQAWWTLVVGAGLSLGVPAAAPGQQTPPGQAPPTIDSIVVEGNERVAGDQIVTTSGLAVGQQINYRSIQRAIEALFRTGQFDDVLVEQRGGTERLILAIRLVERPILGRWAIRGAEKVGEGQVRGKVSVLEGRPIDRAAVERSRAAIDSLYQNRGFYASEVEVRETESGPGAVRLLFDIREGSRVAISQVAIEGNSAFPDDQVVGGMASRPEGFWWFQKGEFTEEKLDEDIRVRLPQWYGDRGYIDFQVLRDTLITDTVPGKAILSLEVDEGQPYYVGTFDVSGNRRYSLDDVSRFFPFGEATRAGDGKTIGVPFSLVDWEAATEQLQNLYANTGYIYAVVQPELIRRTAPDGKALLDLRWNIRENNPAIVNRVIIVGNDITHERVIREQIVLLPGQTFNRDALIRSYQNISNLNFFEQPLPAPDIRPTENEVDVDVVFRVEERRTGNVQFGASVGQGVGVGGFLGLEEPNLFGKGKRGQLQWQFGRNINDFRLTYTDPAFRESRISTTVSLFNSRQRYTIGDLGRQRTEGGSLQVGFPLLGARYTRLFASYGYQRITYSEGSSDLRARFQCESCARSTLGMTIARDTRVGLPFPVAGGSITARGEMSGGFLGGTGDYRKIDLEGRWYAPLATLGGAGGSFGGGPQLVLGLTAKSGFVLGDPGPFFTDIYTMGGVQFGIPLRGYEEFSITPDGFNPNAAQSSATESAFGQSYAAFTVETGVRLSQALYVNAFVDAGNVYREPRQYNPLRMFRSFGFGAAILSPLGPLGLDLGYGLDRVDSVGNPNPGWKLHFRLGNFF